MDTQRYLICYDVPDDRRRDRIARHLDSFGDRVQYSVFEARLGSEHLEEMRVGLEELLDPEEDRVAVYPLCAACAGKVLRLGRGSDDVPPGDEEVFVV